MLEKYNEENVIILLESVIYDPLYGKFYWKDDRPTNHFKTERGHKNWKNRFSGKEIITIHTTGYPSISIGGKIYLQHLVAWRIMYGEWPKQEIDHKDRDRKNNLMSNLRLVNKSDQCWNRGLFKNNNSGIKGVHWSKHNKKWAVYFGVNYIGGFSSLFEACCKRKSLECENGR